MLLQCRKFKGSEDVRSQAGLIYDKFKTLFHLSSETGNDHEVIYFLCNLLQLSFSPFFT